MKNLKNFTYAKTYNVKPRYLSDYKKTPLEILTKDKSQINLLKKTFKDHCICYYLKSDKTYQFIINKINLNGK